MSSAISNGEAHTAGGIASMRHHDTMTRAYNSGYFGGACPRTAAGNRPGKTIRAEWRRGRDQFEAVSASEQFRRASVAATWGSQPREKGKRA